MRERSRAEGRSGVRFKRRTAHPRLGARGPEPRSTLMSTPSRPDLKVALRSRLPGALAGAKRAGADVAGRAVRSFGKTDEADRNAGRGPAAAARADRGVGQCRGGAEVHHPEKLVLRARRRRFQRGAGLLAPLESKPLVSIVPIDVRNVSLPPPAVMSSIRIAGISPCVTGA